MNRMASFVRSHLKLFFALFAVFDALLIGTICSYVYIGSFDDFIVKEDAVKGLETRVAIVFGSGVTKDGKPYDELKGRLDKAAELLASGSVQKLLLSGDNRFAYYNEPDAMRNYLVEEKRIPKEKLSYDYAGRSTYETCERAKKVFLVDKAILISAPSHLPRAIFTCRSFGVESYGVAGGKNANNAGRREVLARAKAMFNVYLIGERTVLGPVEKL